MTNEEQKATMKALLREREGYVRRGLKDRVEQVDARLRQLASDGRAPAKRAEKRK